VLAGAALACLFSASVDEATPVASFDTATPGGSISISLLTPTAPVGGEENQQTTPIGAVATGTAQADMAAALTATAMVPTPTIPGIFTRPATCPAAGTPSLPTSSPSFNRYAEVIVQYLSDGGPTTILEAALRRWDALTERGGLVRADRDFTGDGVPEVLISVFDPQNEDRFPQPGELLVFGCEDEAYRLLYQAGYALDQGAPVIVSADDINGDYLNDLVYAYQTCGEQVCYGHVEAVEWSLTLGNFGSILGEEVVEPQPEVLISDIESDGLGEIVVTAGLISGLDAGPQRTYTRIYAWDGSTYTLSETIYSPTEYRIHVIYDGDDALLAGDYLKAIDFYEQAIEDDQLLSWRFPNEVGYLRAFARYRLMLTHVLRDNISAAQAAHDELVESFIPPTPVPVEGEEGGESEGEPPVETTPILGPAPGVEFARMADFFWADFAVNRDVARACDLVVGYASATPGIFDILNSFGYANRTYTPDDMCPFGR
ncbi:MAG: hypothetical protein P8Z40_00850, partial [Chloroflexota bacterium]